MCLWRARVIVALGLDGRPSRVIVGVLRLIYRSVPPMESPTTTNVQPHARKLHHPFLIKARSHWAAAKEIFFPSRMGNIGLYGAVHMETCGKGNSKGVVINWVLCPIVMAMATTKFLLPLPQLSVNEPLLLIVILHATEKNIFATYFIRSITHILTSSTQIKLEPQDFYTLKTLRRWHKTISKTAAIGNLKG